MSKKTKTVLLILLALFFSWPLLKKAGFSILMSHYQMPAVTVSAVDAVEKTWQPFVSSVGTLSAVNGVDISAEVPGIVSAIHFQSGQDVKKGDVLIELDTGVEQAQLKDNQAHLKLTQINYDRNRLLLQKKVVSPSAFDNSLAELQQAQAAYEGTLARIRQKTITAPFAGKIGIRSVDLGQFIQAGTAIATLQALNPLYIRFNLPEHYVNQIYLKQPIEVEVNLDGGKTIKGIVSAINAKVDQNTRNILVEATIPNEKEIIYPGMFGLVKVWLKQKNHVITVPETSITFSLHGDAVYVIKTDEKNKKILKAFRQFVKVGEHRDDQVVILEGLKAGDKVVTAGQLKLQNGAAVAIDNTVTLE